MSPTFVGEGPRRLPTPLGTFAVSLPDLEVARAW